MERRENGVGVGGREGARGDRHRRCVRRCARSSYECGGSWPRTVEQHVRRARTCSRRAQVCVTAARARDCSTAGRTLGGRVIRRRGRDARGEPVTSRRRARGGGDLAIRAWHGLACRVVPERGRGSQKRDGNRAHFPRFPDASAGSRVARNWYGRGAWTSFAQPLEGSRRAGAWSFSSWARRSSRSRGSCCGRRRRRRGRSTSTRATCGPSAFGAATCSGKCPRRERWCPSTCSG